MLKGNSLENKKFKGTVLVARILKRKKQIAPNAAELIRMLKRQPVWLLTETCHKIIQMVLFYKIEICIVKNLSTLFYSLLFKLFCCARHEDKRRRGKLNPK
jgi:hypothetical protein